jgi:hypothetical protein
LDRWFHELADGLEEGSDVAVMRLDFSFQFRKLLGLLPVCT